MPGIDSAPRTYSMTTRFAATLASVLLTYWLDVSLANAQTNSPEVVGSSGSSTPEMARATAGHSEASSTTDTTAIETGAMPAMAQPRVPGPATAPPEPPKVTTAAPPAPARVLLDEVTFRRRFEDARQALLDNRDEQALAEFEALSEVAPTPSDQRVAEEFAMLAQERVSLKGRELPSPHIRTTDELSVLYTTAFTYGVGTSAWFALQVKPGNFATAILPFVAITTAAVGGVAVVDGYRPFRLGVPMSISAGTLLGTMEGIWLTAYQQAVAERRNEGKWGAPTVATFVWAGATAGGVLGGLLGALREPTPGQVSFTASSAFWGGIVGSLVAGASESQTSYRAERAFAIGGMGYNAALVAALIVSPHQLPSVARVRLVDLGGLAGGLLGAGGYLLVADEDASPRSTLGAGAVGAVLGLGLSWWATAGMPEQRHPGPEPTVLSRLRPSVIPVRQGAVGVLELTL